MATAVCRADSGIEDTSARPMRTDPAAGALIPAIKRPNVDFPAPEGPTIDLTIDVEKA